MAKSQTMTDGRRIDYPQSKSRKWSPTYGPIKFVEVTLQNIHHLHMFKRETIFIAYKRWERHINGLRSPYYPREQPKLRPANNAVLLVPHADRSGRSCGPGVNVGTLEYCMKAGVVGEIWAVAFRSEDIAAVPPYGNGKFRLHRCTVIAKAWTCDGYKWERI